MMKFRTPCYFYNTGGCFHHDGRPKTGFECKYLHVRVSSPMEKPQHLRIPCKYYHLNGWCKKRFCEFGHSELGPQKWARFFPEKAFPGKNYAQLCYWQPCQPVYGY